MLCRNHIKAKYRFTLMELLIVVAIIGILVSILMPSLSNARRKAIQAVCLSNETQQYRTYSLFAKNNGGSVPTHREDYAPSLFHYRVTNTSSTNFVALLKEYTSGFEVWNCPTYGNIPAIDDTINSRSMNYIAYSYFPGRAEPNFGLATKSAKNFSADNADADHIFLQDNVRDHSSIGLGIWTNHSAVAATPGPSNNPSSITRRVPAMSQVYGANILFYDGHAKWVHGTSLKNVGRDSTNGNLRTYSVFPE